LTVGLLAAFALTSCEIDEPPPRRTQRPVAKYPQPQQTQYPVQPQPFPQDGPPTVPTTGSEPTQDPTSPPAQASPAAVAKGDYQYGIPVPGKPGFVHSPYSPDKMTDVRGYAPGTEVKDPYTGKIFLVP
ncbi:MAG TPA: hypothetical protein VF551_00545, partial [Chthoniobacterales bacterium]